jgi:hypothetical protein
VIAFRCGDKNLSSFDSECQIWGLLIRLLFLNKHLYLSGVVNCGYKNRQKNRHVLQRDWISCLKLDNHPRLYIINITGRDLYDYINEGEYPHFGDE